VADAGAALAEAAAAVAAAMRAGAGAAEVFVRTGPTERLTWRGHDLVTETRGVSCDVVLRVWRGGRGLALTAGALAPGLRDLARSAVAAVGSHGEETSPCLRPGPVRAVVPAGPEEPDGGSGRLRETLAEVAALPGLRDAQLTAVSTRGRQWTVIVNSLGAECAYETAQRVTWLWADWPSGRLGDAEFGADAAAVAAAGRRLAGLATLMAADHARPAGDAAAVLLGPTAAAHLARSLGGLLTADNLLRGLRPLLDRRGRRIASAAVDLTDGAAAGARPMDEEGVPARPVRLLSAGRLTGVLHTLRSARELAEDPTGSAHRPQLWRPPVAGPSDVRIEAGTERPAGLRAAMGTGIEVVGVGRPGRIQQGTGNLTLTAHGWLVEGGERTRPLLGVPLSANVFELLRGVRARADDLAHVPLADGAGAPSLLLDRMRIG
jgi:PmbA protein